MKCFACDFETTTDLDDCRVWAFACCQIGDSDNFFYGNTLDGFMEWCANKKENFKCFFHNLKFDGSFIVEHLLLSGFEYVSDKKDRRDKTFTTLITDMGQWYQIEIWFKVNGHKVNKVTILDSLKILNFSVDFIASKKGFNLPQQKLELDYRKKREIGHQLTEEEVAYIHNDVWIMAEALDIMFNQNLKKMTIAGDALSNYKDMCPHFKNLFPKLSPEIDDEIRLSYKGGFTYVSDKYAGKEVGAGVTLDVNSLYPSRMKFEYMPVGEPERFQGKYKKDKFFPLYIQKLNCVFDLKPDKIPSIQIKHHLSFIQNEYLKSSNGEIVELMLTKPDLELFFEQYDVHVISWDGGFKFKQMKGLFDDYIDHWTESKIQAKKDGNQALYLISKLMLNLYTASSGQVLSERRKILSLWMEKFNISQEKRSKKKVSIFQWLHSSQHMLGATQ